MKKTAIIVLAACLIPVVSNARDFTVKVLHENYREEGELIYHSVQVDSIAGSKVLVLQGTDKQYRKWLREYMVSADTFIAKVPDEDSFQFISSKVYTIDVSSVHPVKPDGGETFPSGGGGAGAVMDENQIMIVDGNMKRRRLIRQVVEHLGYASRVFTSGKEAYDIFRLHPERFHLVITSREVGKLSVEQLVEKCINLSPGLPVLVGAGYSKKGVGNRLFEEFSGIQNVYVKPVILDNLTKSIVRILRKKKA
jgi:CheY-like chemotaxis protein